MTLIATFDVQGFPIVFGDLLTTGMKINDKVVATPAAGEVQNFFGDEWAVRGLSQKLNLISDRCVIAWTGSQRTAGMAIKELRRMSVAGVLTLPTMMDYLSNDPVAREAGDGFLGLFVEEGEKYPHTFYVRADRRSSSSFGEVIRQGSGIEAIDEFLTLLENSPAPRGVGDVNAASMAIGTGLSIGGMLLNQELRNGDSAKTIQNMFGGGYEIAFFASGKVRKLEEVTYLFWDAKVAPDGVHLALPPRLVVKQKYLGDSLVIRSARMAGDVNGIRFEDEQFHVINPLFDAPLPDQAQLIKTELYSPMFCHSIVVDVGGRNHIYTQVQQCQSREKAMFDFEEHDGQVFFAFKQEGIFKIAQALERFRS